MEPAKNTTRAAGDAGDDQCSPAFPGISVLEEINDHGGMLEVFLDGAGEFLISALGDSLFDLPEYHKGSGFGLGSAFEGCVP